MYIVKSKVINEKTYEVLNENEKSFFSIYNAERYKFEIEDNFYSNRNYNKLLLVDIEKTSG